MVKSNSNSAIRRDSLEESPAISTTSTGSGGFLSMSKTKMMLSMVDDHSSLGGGGVNGDGGSSPEASDAGSPTPIEPKRTKTTSRTSEASMTSIGEKSEGSDELTQSKKDMMRALLAEYGLDDEVSFSSDSNKSSNSATDPEEEDAQSHVEEKADSNEAGKDSPQVSDVEERTETSTAEEDMEPSDDEDETLDASDVEKEATMSGSANDVESSDADDDLQASGHVIGASWRDLEEPLHEEGDAGGESVQESDTEIEIASLSDDEVEVVPITPLTPGNSGRKSGRTSLSKSAESMELDGTASVSTPNTAKRKLSSKSILTETSNEQLSNKAKNAEKDDENDIQRLSTNSAKVESVSQSKSSHVSASGFAESETLDSFAINHSSGEESGINGGNESHNSIEHDQTDQDSYRVASDSDSDTNERSIDETEIKESTMFSNRVSPSSAVATEHGSMDGSKSKAPSISGGKESNREAKEGKFAHIGSQLKVDKETESKSSSSSKKDLNTDEDEPKLQGSPGSNGKSDKGQHSESSRSTQSQRSKSRKVSKSNAPRKASDPKPSAAKKVTNTLSKPSSEPKSPQVESDDDSSVESPLQSGTAHRSVGSLEALDTTGLQESDSEDSEDESPILLIRPKKTSVPEEEESIKSAEPQSKHTDARGKDKFDSERHGSKEPIKPKISSKSQTKDLKSRGQQSKTESPKRKKDKPKPRKAKNMGDGHPNELKEVKKYPVQDDEENDDELLLPLNDMAEHLAQQTKGKSKSVKSKPKTSKRPGKAKAANPKVKTTTNASQLPPYELTNQRSPSDYDQYAKEQHDDNRSMGSVDSDGIWRPPKKIAVFDVSQEDEKSMEGSKGSLDDGCPDFTNVEWNGVDTNGLHRGNYPSEKTQGIWHPQTPDTARYSQNASLISTIPPTDEFAKVDVGLLQLSANPPETSSNDFQKTPEERKGMSRFLRWPKSSGADNSQTPKTAKSMGIFPWSPMPRLPSSTSLDNDMIKEEKGGRDSSKDGVENFVPQSPVVVARSLPESYPSLQSPEVFQTGHKDFRTQNTPKPKKPKSSAWLPWARKQEANEPSLDPTTRVMSDEKLHTHSAPSPAKNAPRQAAYSAFELPSGRHKQPASDAMSVAEQREARRQQFISDQRRRESIKIQSVVRGFMTRKPYSLEGKEGKVKQTVEQGDTREQKAPYIPDENELPSPRKSKHVVKASAGTRTTVVEPSVSSEMAITKPTAAANGSLPLRRRHENRDELKTVAQQREERRQTYLLDQQRRASIEIQRAVRGFVVRKQRGLDKIGKAQQSHTEPVRSGAPTHEVVESKQLFSPRKTAAKSGLVSPPPTPQTKSKKSTGWLPWGNKTSALSPNNSLGESKENTNESTNVQRFDASLYVRKRIYQDEQDSQAKTIDEIRDARRQMYLRDLERREVIKIQAAARGFVTRQRSNPPRKSKKSKKEKKEKKQHRKSSRRLKEEPSGILPDSFDRSAYLVERLQRDEAERQTKSVAQVRHERQEIYLRDLQRREATKIEAAMRGYMTRKQYSIPSRTLQQSKNRPSRPKTMQTARRPSLGRMGSKDSIVDIAKSSSNWGLVKRFFLGKPEEETPGIEENFELEIPANEKFDPYDFFGFNDPKYKERTGFFVHEKSRRTEHVEVQSVTQDARNWKGRKNRERANTFDKDAYLRQRKAQEEFDRQSMTIAQRNKLKQKAVKQDAERRAAEKIQKIGRGYIARRHHPLSKKKNREKRPTSVGQASRKDRKERQGDSKASRGPMHRGNVDTASRKNKRTEKTSRKAPVTTEPKDVQLRSVGPNVKSMGTEDSPAALRKVDVKIVTSPPAVNKQTQQEIEFEEEEIVIEYESPSEEFEEEVIEEIVEEEISPRPAPISPKRVQENIPAQTTAKSPRKARATLARSPKPKQSAPATPKPKLSPKPKQSASATPKPKLSPKLKQSASATPKAKMSPKPKQSASATPKSKPSSRPKQSALAIPTPTPIEMPQNVRKPAEPKNESVTPLDSRSQAPMHPCSTYSTGVGESWWLPSVSSEDTRSYRQEVYVPQARPYQTYAKPVTKKSTTDYWEAVRDTYLPSRVAGSDDGNITDDGVSLVPSVSTLAAQNQPSKQFGNTNFSSVVDDGSWLPPDAGGVSRSIPAGNAEQDSKDEESWVPLPSKPKPRSQRVDFSGMAQKDNESFRWAPHLPSPSKRDNARLEQMIGIRDIETPPLQNEVSDEENPTSQDRKAVREAAREAPSCCSWKTIFITWFVFLILVVGGGTAAYFLWKNPPWSKLLKH